MKNGSLPAKVSHTLILGGCRFFHEDGHPGSPRAHAVVSTEGQGVFAEGFVRNPAEPYKSFA